MPKSSKPTEAPQRGLLISFEGSEGCGKTTQISRLVARLENSGYQTLVTREPGGTAIGEDIRHLLKHAQSGQGMCPETELLLFAASRAQMVREVIVPGLQSGKIILSDRFLDSTTVYQGVARRLSKDPVQIINNFAVGDILPDVTVVLDIPAEIGLARARQRVNDIPDRMEQENISFYQQVREGYLILAQGLPERFRVIDGTQSIEAVEADVWKAISKLLPPPTNSIH